jgi:hypothetical protein
MRGIYGAGKGDWFDHDNYFKPYEALNSIDLDPMLNSRSEWLDADSWIKLAAYVASRLTRDIDAELSTMAVSAQWRKWSMGYPLDFQRISGAVLRTRWALVSCAEEFILSDRGFYGILPIWEGPALFVPLRPHVGALIGGGARYQKQILWQDGRWMINVPALSVAPQVVGILNAVAWASSRSECYASHARLLSAARVDGQHAPPPLVDLGHASKYVHDILGSDIHQLMEDEMLMFKILGGIRVPESGEPRAMWV